MNGTGSNIQRTLFESPFLHLNGNWSQSRYSMHLFIRGLLKSSALFSPSPLIHFHTSLQSLATGHYMRDSCPVIIYICLGCVRFSSGICIYIFPHLKTSATVSVSIHALPVSVSDSSSASKIKRDSVSHGKQSCQLCRLPLRSIRASWWNSRPS